MGPERSHCPHCPQFAILVKGAINSCATIPKEIKNRVDSCRELPNSDGREAHSMAWFMYTFYDTLPRLSVFTQVSTAAAPAAQDAGPPAEPPAMCFLPCRSSAC